MDSAPLVLTQHNLNGSRILDLGLGTIRGESKKALPSCNFDSNKTLEFPEVHRFNFYGNLDAHIAYHSTMELQKYEQLRRLKSWLKLQHANLRRIPVGLGHYNAPTAMIVGVQKGGTTALHHMLMQHDLIRGGIKKEVHFFDDDKADHTRELTRYHAQFKLPFATADGTVFLDSTPAYSAAPVIIQRIKRYNPAMKLIFLMRDPVNRAYSHWAMQHRRDPKTHQHVHQPLSFEEAIEANFQRIAAGIVSPLDCNYIERGHYLATIQTLLEHFPEGQILLLQNNEVKEMSEQTSRRIQSFLGVPYQHIHPILRNQNPHPITPHEPTIDRLKKHYAPLNEALFDFLKTPQNWS